MIPLLYILPILGKTPNNQSTDNKSFVTDIGGGAGCTCNIQHADDHQDSQRPVVSRRNEEVIWTISSTLKDATYTPVKYKPNDRNTL